MTDQNRSQDFTLFLGLYFRKFILLLQEYAILLSSVLNSTLE